MKKKLTPEDLKLWENIIKDVKPLHKLKPKPIAAPKRESIPQNLIHVRVTKLRSNSPQPMSRKEFRHVEIEARLDMHGMTLNDAYQALERFLKRAQENGYRTVLIITGKGALSSENTLRRQLPRWLEEKPFRDLIVSFSHPVKPQHGGQGAFYVRVKRKPLKLS